jgi:hypothetical protein
VDPVWRLRLHMRSLDLHPRHRMEQLGSHGVFDCIRRTSHVSQAGATLYAADMPRLYTVRRVLSAMYNYRISKSQAYLDSLYQEKDTTIEKLKQATKYDSTQQLLDKYGERKSPPRESAKDSDLAGKSRRASSDRVFIVPPPTANIPRNRPSLPPGSAPIQEDSSKGVPSGPQSAPDHPQQPGPETTAEFAPNAFDQSAQYARPGPTERRWFDRLLDSIMGEDETLATMRLALVCSQCRLVNGLAPPGVRTLEEVGKWRCRECGAWNGEEPETVRIVKAVATEKTSATSSSDDRPETGTAAEKPDPAEAEVVKEE